MSVSIRIWGAACGAAAVLVLAGGFFVGLQPALASASAAVTSAVGVETQNQATQVRLVNLTKAAAKLDSLKAEDAALQVANPSILKPNRFIRRINEVAALDGVTVGAVSLSDAIPYTAPASAAAAAAVAADGSVGLALAKTDPAITPANFTAVPVSVDVTGTEAATMLFAHDIQNDQRTFAISGIQTTSSDSSEITATFSGYVYVLKR